MNDTKQPGITISRSLFRAINRGVKKEYGRGLAEIAQTEEADIAFQALKKGIMAFFEVPKGVTVLDNADAVKVERDMDGDSAYRTIVACAADVLVGDLVDEYETSESGVAIEVTYRGLVGRLLGRGESTQTVVYIPPTQS